MGKSSERLVYGLENEGWFVPAITEEHLLTWHNPKFHGKPIFTDPIEAYNWRKLMGDSLHLSGPDANMERDSFMAEQERAENLDGSKIRELLCKVFVDPPAKTIDEQTPEETLQHKYWMEEMVRLFRVHLLVVDRKQRKDKVKVGDKIFKDLDKTYKPKPIPASRQATNEYEKLVMELMEKKNLTREEAEEILK